MSGRTRRGSVWLTQELNTEALIQGTGMCLRAALERKADADDVEDYRSLVLGLPRHVAESREEGGHLGIGATRVTENEQAALDEIAAALVSEPR